MSILTIEPMRSHNPKESIIETALIVGAGRLAWSLIPAMQQAGVQVKGIISKTYSEAKRYSNTYSINNYIPGQKFPDADIVILTVPDSAIEEVAKELSPTLNGHQILVHTSGSISLGALGAYSGTGVFYPMQAFTKDSVVLFNHPDIPLFVEGANELVKTQLLDLARKLSGRVQLLDSEARRKLHLGAVIACNFSNLMYRLTDELTPEVDFGVFESLIRNQVELAMKLGPAAAQTGPAVRGDQQTIEAHLQMLHGKPDIQEMYIQLSRLINPAITEPQDL